MKLYFLVFFFLASKAKNLSPYDIAEEAEKQLENLKTTVQTEILLAHDAMSSNLQDFVAQSAAQNTGGQVYIQTQYAYVSEHVSALESLGNSAGVDVTPCVDSPKQKIENLTREYPADLAICIGGVNLQAGQILTDGLYAVDVYFSKVNGLEFQLRQCGGQLVCVSTVATEIEKSMVKIPQDIQVEVSNVKDFMQVLALSVDDCVNSHVSAYGSEVENILSDMAVCVNNMLNK